MVRFAFVAAVLLLAGCSDSPSSPATGPSSTSPLQQADEMAAVEPPFEPQAETWSAQTSLGVCRRDGTSLSCFGTGLGGSFREFDIPPRAGNLTLTLTWSDPAGRQLNVAVYGVTEEAIIQRGASPLTLTTTIAPGSEAATILVEHYLVDLGAAYATTPVEFGADLTFLA